jgi:hypothetical protein
MSDGAVAQLGERLLCKQDVIGSIPVSSTILSKVKVGNKE